MAFLSAGAPRPRLRQCVRLPQGRPRGVEQWRQQEFQDWAGVKHGVALRYPARFDAVRGFGKFTSRDVSGGLTETDLVAFRGAEPRAVIVVALYRSPVPLAWAEWGRRARGPAEAAPSAPGNRPTPFPLEFGGTERKFAATRAGNRPALRVSALGAVKYPLRGNEEWERWRFESVFVAEGAEAVRVTAGLPEADWPYAAEGLEKVLASIRWTPPPKR